MIRTLAALALAGMVFADPATVLSGPAVPQATRKAPSAKKLPTAKRAPGSKGRIGRPGLKRKAFKATPRAVLERKAARLMRERRYRAAAKVQSQVIAKNPDAYEAFGRRSLARRLAGNVSGANADANKARELRLKALDKDVAAHPKTARARLQRSMLRAHAGDLKGALQDVDAVIASDAKHARAHFQRGNLQARKGANADALQSYNRALKLNPKLGEVYGARAELKLKMGKKKGANRDLDHSRKYQRATETAASK